MRERERHRFHFFATPCLSLSAAKKLKKDKLGAYSSPGRVKSGRGPGRPPKHPRVEDTPPNPPSSELLTLKVRNLKKFARYIVRAGHSPTPHHTPPHTHYSPLSNSTTWRLSAACPVTTSSLSFNKSVAWSRRERDVCAQGLYHVSIFFIAEDFFHVNGWV